MKQALKMCREALHFPGAFIDVREHTAWHWPAYLAGHPEASKVFRSPVVDFIAEVFPEKDPSTCNPSCLRLDFVAIRKDGSAVRIHPHRHKKETKVAEGSLEEWRAGRQPLYVPDRAAVQEVNNRTARATSQPPPPPGPPPLGQPVCIPNRVAAQAGNHTTAGASFQPLLPAGSPHAAPILLCLSDPIKVRFKSLGNPILFSFGILFFFG